MSNTATIATIIENHRNYFVVCLPDHHNAEAVIAKHDQGGREADDIAAVEIANVRDRGVGEVYSNHPDVRGYVRHGMVSFEAFPLNAEGERIVDWPTYVTAYYSADAL